MIRMMLINTMPDLSAYDSVRHDFYMSLMLTYPRVTA